MRLSTGGDVINTLAGPLSSPPRGLRLLPVVRPLLFGFLQGLVHGLLVLPSTLGTVPLALGFVIQPHAGEMEPFDGALVIVTADHLSIGDLIAQTVRRLVRVNGKVRRGRFPLGFGLGAFLLLGGFCFLLLRRSGGDVIVVVIIGRVLSVLVVALSPRPLIIGLLRLRDCLTLGLILAGFAAVASGVIDLLMGLKELHVTVHLPGPVLHQLHHLTHDLDLLVAQLLAPNQGSLNAMQHSPFLDAVCLAFEFLIVLIQFLQDFCKGKISIMSNR